MIETQAVIIVGLIPVICYLFLTFRESILDIIDLDNIERQIHLDGEIK